MAKTIICLLIFISACSQPVPEPDFTFVVSSFNRPKDPNEPPPPPPPPYPPFNFIIDSAEQVYYYQLQAARPKEYSCTDLTPVFINLQPQHIVQIPLTSINDFVKANIFQFDKDYRYISISCQKDTVKSIGLKVLFDIFSNTYNHSNFFIRRTTQEENVVLAYKLKQLYYSPDSIR